MERGCMIIMNFNVEIEKIRAIENLRKEQTEN
jgi:hypothetical protein